MSYTLEITFAVLVAITIGLVEILKRTKRIKNEYLPLASLVIGFLVTLVAGITNFSNITLLQGLIVGLVGSGSYDVAAKSIVGK
jgi:hypothetical protein